MRLLSNAALVVALLTIVASCSDDGPGFPTGAKHWLIHIERVTLASDTPDRVEIEIVVRTGSSLSEVASDGTPVRLSTTSGRFEGGGDEMRVPTDDGHALVILILPPERPARCNVTARVDTAQATMSILVDEAGFLRLGV